MAKTLTERVTQSLSADATPERDQVPGGIEQPKVSDHLIAFAENVTLPGVQLLKPARKLPQSLQIGGRAATEALRRSVAGGEGRPFCRSPLVPFPLTSVGFGSTVLGPSPRSGYATWFTRETCNGAIFAVPTASACVHCSLDRIHAGRGLARVCCSIVKADG